ncbi:putative transcriptional regulator [Kitasatospora sp. GAS1066B]
MLDRYDPDLAPSARGAGATKIAGCLFPSEQTVQNYLTDRHQARARPTGAEAGA